MLTVAHPYKILAQKTKLVSHLYASQVPEATSMLSALLPYKTITYVYEFLAAKEDWCRG